MTKFEPKKTKIRVVYNNSTRNQTYENVFSHKIENGVLFICTERKTEEYESDEYHSTFDGYNYKNYKSTRSKDTHLETMCFPLTSITLYVVTEDEKLIPEPEKIDVVDDVVVNSTGELIAQSGAEQVQALTPEKHWTEEI